MEKDTQENKKNDGGEELNLEKKQRKAPLKIPYGTIGRAILGTVAVAGVLSVAVVAPNLFQVLRLFRGYDRRSMSRYEAPSYVRKTLKRLHHRGMVRIYDKNGEAVVRLTDKGERELLKYQLQEKRLGEWRWDKKWRIIIFDIPEKRRFARDGIRDNMESFGFEKLQNSVWVYPYECEEIVVLLKSQYKIGKELIYIVAGDIENDDWLRKKFKL